MKVKTSTLVLLLALVAFTVTVLLVMQKTPRRTYSGDAVFLDPASSLSPLTDRDPGSVWLTRQCFRGLFRFGANDALEMDLAERWVGRMTVSLQVNSSARLPSGGKPMAKNIEAYLGYLKQEKKRDPRLDGLQQIRDAGKDHVDMDFSTLAPEVEEALQELFGRDLVRSAAVRQTVILSLKKGLKWDDAHAITVKDALFTYQQHKKAGHASPYAYLIRDIDSVKAVDDTTLEIVSGNVSTLSLAFWTVPLLPEFHYTAPVSAWPAFDPAYEGGARAPHFFLKEHHLGHTRFSNETIRMIHAPSPENATQIDLPIRERWVIGFNLTAPFLRSEGVRRELALAAHGLPAHPVQPFELEVLCVTDREDILQEGEQAIERWKPVGVTVRLQKLDPAEFQKRLRTRNFEAFIGSIDEGGCFRWAQAVDPSEWPEGQNYFGYTQSEVGRLVERLNAVTDPARRKALAARLDEFVARDVPYVILKDQPARLFATGRGSEWFR